MQLPVLPRLCVDGVFSITVSFRRRGGQKSLLVLPGPGARALWGALLEGLRAQRLDLLVYLFSDLLQQNHRGEADEDTLHSGLQRRGRWVSTCRLCDSLLHHLVWKYMQMRPGYWLSHGLSSCPLLSLTECLDFTLVCMCVCPYLKQSAYLSWWLFLLVRLLAWHSLFICFCDHCSAYACSLWFKFLCASAGLSVCLNFCHVSKHFPSVLSGCVCVCLCVFPHSHCDGCGVDHSDGG